MASPRQARISLPQLVSSGLRDTASISKAHSNCGRQRTSFSSFHRHAHTCITPSHHTHTRNVCTHIPCSHTRDKHPFTLPLNFYQHILIIQKDGFITFAYMYTMCFSMLAFLFLSCFLPHSSLTGLLPLPKEFLFYLHFSFFKVWLLSMQIFKRQLSKFVVGKDENTLNIIFYFIGK